MLSPTTSDLLPNSGQMAFLRRMSQDDEFRATLEVDPQKALAEYGLHVDPQDLPAVVTLPSQVELQAGLSYLASSEEDEKWQTRWVLYLGA